MNKLTLKNIQKVVDELEALGDQEYYGLGCPVCSQPLFGSAYAKDNQVKFYCPKCDEIYITHKESK